MHCAEAINRGSCEGIDGCFVADVGRHSERPGAQAHDLVLGGLQPALLDVGQHHIEPGAGEPFGHSQADTGGSPGDDGNLPCGQLHGRLLSLAATHQVFSGLLAALVVAGLSRD